MFFLFCSVMENTRVIMNAPLFFQLLIYGVFISLNLLSFDEVLIDKNLSALISQAKAHTISRLIF